MKLNLLDHRYTKICSEVDWSFRDLANRCSSPTITLETQEDFFKMKKEQQDNLKDKGGFIAGELNKGKRGKNDVINRTMLSLDADFVETNENLTKIYVKVKSLNAPFIIYDTRKSTVENPRVRIVIPFSKPVDPEAYEAVARKVCEFIGIEFFDPTTVEVNRFMYFPTCSSDYKDLYRFYYENREEKYLQVEDFLSSHYSDWHNRQEWPRFPNETKQLENDLKQQEDPLEKEGTIGAFCRAYFPIAEAIETFLPDSYEATAYDDRFTYAGGSTYAGAIVYDDRFLYSHHATDPASEQLCNAFDLVRIHKFGDNKDSQNKMLDLAVKDIRVKKQLANDRQRQLEEDFGNLGEVIKTDAKSEENMTEPKEKKEDWSLKLDYDRQGKPKSTVDNIILILDNDPRLKGFYQDSFAIRPKIEKSMPWDSKNEKEKIRNWGKYDDSGLRWFLEKYYLITGKQKIDDARNVVFNKNKKHPVLDYLSSLNWDGTQRLKTLLIDYFGAEDNQYSRDVIYKSLLAAVMRVRKPGVKFDYMPILIGKQGIGKSTFLKILGGDWFSDSYIDFASKEGYQMLQGHWIIEIGELTGFYKKEVEQIKSFLSKQKDEYRAPYSEHVEEHFRQCVIFGTTNNKTFLRDQTGNRRFWPVELGVNQPTKDVFEDLEKEIDQIWAEAYAMSFIDNRLYLTGESEKLALVEQEKRTESSITKDDVISFLLKKVPEDWLHWDVKERLTYWSNEELYDNEENLVERDRVCIKEILVECFNYPDGSRLDQRDSKPIKEVLKSDRTSDWGMPTIITGHLLAIKLRKNFTIFSQILITTKTRVK